MMMPQYPGQVSKSEMLKNYLIQTCHPYQLQVIETLVNEQIRENLIKYREQQLNCPSTLIDLTVDPVKASPDDRKAQLRQGLMSHLSSP